MPGPLSSPRPRFRSWYTLDHFLPSVLPSDRNKRNSLRLDCNPRSKAFVVLWGPVRWKLISAGMYGSLIAATAQRTIAKTFCIFLPPIESWDLTYPRNDTSFELYSKPRRDKNRFYILD